ncbi:hypothetical protein [Mycobacterium sp. URHB0021]
MAEGYRRRGDGDPRRQPIDRGRNEVVLAGQYRIAIGDDIIGARPGTRATAPRNTPDSWRNIATGEGRLLIVVTPGGFEQPVLELSARYGCEILGPPTV